MKKIRQAKSITYRFCHVALIVSSLVLLTACSSSNIDTNVASADISKSNSTGRTNKINVLTPTATGEKTTGNDIFTLDYSNSSEGYIVLLYTGTSEKVKFQIACEGQTTYTYNIVPNLETVIPLSSDDGTYNVALYECMGDDQYSVAFSDDIAITIDNKFGPFLYPNQYVNFSAETKAVAKSAEVVKDATCDLDAVFLVYALVIGIESPRYESIPCSPNIYTS